MSSKHQQEDKNRSEEYDWLFDFVLQFLESDKFDCSVMDFVDEKCDVFDDDDENKFIYSDIHREFREHIEALISSNLGELGITTEIFYESCERGRHGRDINMAVFEKMVAMDDFQTFKKIMVKRNMELQLEAFRSYTNIPSSRSSGKKSSNSRVGIDDDEEDNYHGPQKALFTSDDSGAKGDDSSITGPLSVHGHLTEQELQDILHQSLMEMELMNRQEELEQAELERAVALSLALEEEELRLKNAETKRGSDTDEVQQPSSPDSKKSNIVDSASSKSTSALSPSSSHKQPQIINNDSDDNEKDEGGFNLSSSFTRKPKSIAPVTTSSSSSIYADPKPFKIRNDLGSKPLPSIRPSSGMDSLSSISAELEGKKRQAEEAIRKNQEQLNAQRRQEEELRKQLIVDPDEAERRAQHMREQRDRLIAIKKAERGKLVEAENERLAKVDADEEGVSQFLTKQKQFNQAEEKGPSSPSSSNISPEEIERRRSLMAMALARRMKIELNENEETKISKLKQQQLADINRRLQQVETTHARNVKRQQSINQNILKGSNGSGNNSGIDFIEEDF